MDIEGGNLLRWDWRGGASLLQLATAPTCVLFDKLGEVYVFTDLALRRVNTETGQLEDPRAVLPSTPGPAVNHRRTNDGGVDPDGVIWVGTMSLTHGVPGDLYKAGDDGFETAIEGVGLPNGPAWSPDGGTMYHVDSEALVVRRYSVGSLAGNGDGETFLQLNEADGMPDGLTVNSNGDVWVALWGGGEVRRYSAAGRLLEVVVLPRARFPTAVCLGDSDLRTLFITTANHGAAAGPDGGYLHVIRVECPGLTENRFEYQRPIAPDTVHQIDK